MLLLLLFLKYEVYGVFLYSQCRMIFFCLRYWDYRRRDSPSKPMYTAHVFAQFWHPQKALHTIHRSSFLFPNWQPPTSTSAAGKWGDAGIYISAVALKIFILCGVHGVFTVMVVCDCSKWFLKLQGAQIFTYVHSSSELHLIMTIIVVSLQKYLIYIHVADPFRKYNKFIIKLGSASRLNLL